MKVKGMGTTAHNTLADEGVDEDGTTTGASGGRDDRAVQIGQLNMMLQ